jgi:hypothetical protein
MDSVEIAWPNGQTELLSDVPSDFIYTITEGQGITGRVALLLTPKPSASAATASR